MIDLIQWAKHRYPTIMDMRTIKGGGIRCLIVLWQNYPIIMHTGTICRDWHASSDCFIIKYKWNWLSASIWHIMFTKLNMSISLYESRESLGSQNWSHLWPWPLKTKEVSILLYNPTGWQVKKFFINPIERISRFLQQIRCQRWIALHRKRTNQVEWAFYDQ